MRPLMAIVVSRDRSRSTVLTMVMLPRKPFIIAPYSMGPCPRILFGAVRTTYLQKAGVERGPLG